MSARATNAISRSQRKRPRGVIQPAAGPRWTRFPPDTMGVTHKTPGTARVDSAFGGLSASIDMWGPSRLTRRPPGDARPTIAAPSAVEHRPHRYPLLYDPLLYEGARPGDTRTGVRSRDRPRPSRQ